MKNTLVILLTTLLLTSCNTRLKDAVGTYKGSIAILNQKNLIPVNAIVSSDKSKLINVKINCIPTAELKCQYQMNITSPFIGKYKIDLSGDTNKSIEINVDMGTELHGRPCIENADSEFCVSPDQLIVSFLDNQNNKVTFNLVKYSELVADHNTEENPRSYKLSELLDLASKYDFSTRIEFQRYLESKYNAKAMLLSQLPHVSTGTVGVFLGGINAAAILQGVGDLLPFILPNRWLQVKETDLLSKAEVESAVIMKLNAVLFTEQLAYNFEKDKNIQSSLLSERAKISNVYNELVMREKLGQIPFGSSQDVLSILNNIDQALLQVELTLKQDLQALSMSIGLANPDGVIDIVFDINREVHETNLNISILQDKVISISHEVHQADILLNVAKTQKVERYFSMFDPSVSPQLALGAALFPVAKQSAAQVQEFTLMKSQIIAQTFNKVEGLVDSLAFDINNDKLVKQSIDIQQKRVDRILGQLTYGTNFVLSDLVGALQDQVTAQINNITNAALYKTTEAQMDRMLLKGYYQQYNVLNKE